MWYTALLLGLAGSLHCLSMCSPLAMAVTSMRHPFFINRLVYNGGRILTYGLLGVLFSAFGSLFQFPAIQQWLSIGLGCALIVLGITGIGNIKIPFVSAFIYTLTLQLKKWFAVFIHKKSTISILFLGMLNGLLPCGLTYLALTYCITLTSPAYGFIFMLLFGAGTLPVMLGITSVLQTLINRFHINFSKVNTYALIGLGVLLISRSFVSSHHTSHSPHSETEIPVCR
jgi:sulfite exporter TauE/SafE